MQKNKLKKLSDQVWDDSTLPTVSIVVATYNHEKYLAQAFDGFLMQSTNFKVEIMVNDDASTDQTKSVIESYVKKYPTLILPFYQIENQYSKGKKPWFHVLFPAARGKYVATCEGDDFWTDPLKLQKQVDFLEANDGYNLCAHNVNVLTNNSVLNIHPGLVQKDLFLENILFDMGYNFIPTCSIVFRNNIIDFVDFGFFTDFGDWPLLYLLSKNSKLKFFEDNMGSYRKHDGGYTNINKESMLLKIIKFYYKILILHPEFKGACLLKISQLERKILSERTALTKKLTSKKYLSVNLGYRAIFKILALKTGITKT